MTQTPAPPRCYERRPLDTWRVIAVIAAVAGATTRWWLVHQPVGALDADSAITGLMAREFLRGRWTTYYWGQSYGGSLEAIFTAVVFRAFGSGPMTLVLSSVTLNAIAADWPGLHCSPSSSG